VLGLLIATSVVPLGFAVKKIKHLQEVPAIQDAAEKPAQQSGSDYASRESQLHLRRQISTDSKAQVPESSQEEAQA
jgi:hypothetical protein